MSVQYKLVITEKPSVAKAYADVLGAKKKQDGFFEGNGYLISWCVGHLVELVMPQDYDEKYRRWLAEDLPIIPEEWKYRVTSSTRKQFNILERLMKRKDVKEILCATDAGREGELIFRLVYEKARCRKSFKRIWLSSMEDIAIKKAFAHPRPGVDYDRLYEAARCREQADWIVGINATRLFSCLYRDTLNIGRVMTPTLAMVTERENAIKSFVPEPFYVVRITAEGVAFDSQKYGSRDQALELARACKEACVAIVQNVAVKEKKENPPLLFDLTSLQREANKRFGFSAQQTLDYAQSLYEKKLLTYPRTDSKYVTSDMEKTLPALIKKTAGPVTGMAGEKDLQVSRLINDAGVTDHTALLPTANSAAVDLDSLPSGERTLLEMVVCRLLSATSTPHIYEETKVTITCGGEEFTANGKRILDSGWRKYESENAEETILPAFKKKMQLTPEEIAIKNGQTKPPARFTEGTLLHAMETAGKDEIPDDAERSGIGTPATRAGIIEKLVRIGFLQRTGDKKTKTLIPTERGQLLIRLVPEELRSAAMTADWEKKLLAIEHGDITAEEFMREIEVFTEQLVQTERTKPRRELPPAAESQYTSKKAAKSPDRGRGSGKTSSRSSTGRLSTSKRRRS